jgi:hypothetical protein
LAAIRRASSLVSSLVIAHFNAQKPGGVLPSDHSTCVGHDWRRGPRLLAK